jgi:hypothetical protein
MPRALHRTSAFAPSTDGSFRLDVTRAGTDVGGDDAGWMGLSTQSLGAAMLPGQPSTIAVHCRGVRTDGWEIILLTLPTLEPLCQLRIPGCFALARNLDGYSATLWADRIAFGDGFIVTGNACNINLFRFDAFADTSSSNSGDGVGSISPLDNGQILAGGEELRTTDATSRTRFREARSSILNIMLHSRVPLDPTIGSYDWILRLLGVKPGDTCDPMPYLSSAHSLTGVLGNCFTTLQAFDRLPLLAALETRARVDAVELLPTEGGGCTLFAATAGAVTLFSFETVAPGNGKADPV